MKNGENTEEIREKYPCLEQLYEHVKDTLSYQSNVLSNLTGKATFLWGAISTVLAIIISVISLNSHVDTFKSTIFISILILYAVTTIMAGFVIFPKYWSDTPDFYNLWSEFASLPKENFWYHMYANIQEASDKNERRLLYDAFLIRFMSLTVLAQVILLLIWAISFWK